MVSSIPFLTRCAFLLNRFDKEIHVAEQRFLALSDLTRRCGAESVNDPKRACVVVL